MKIPTGYRETWRPHILWLWVWHLGRFSLRWIYDCHYWRGRVLTGTYRHWCFDWDELPVDETTPEWPCDCGKFEVPMATSTNDRRVPLYLFHVSGYRTFTSWWWNDVLMYVTGLEFYRKYMSLTRESVRLEWSLPGWWRDLYTFYHRGRYGWAPRDTWNLDSYLNGVFAGSLTYLSQHHHGFPWCVYEEILRQDGRQMTNEEAHAYIGALSDEERDQLEARAQAVWPDMLNRWAQAFFEDPADVKIYDRQTGYAAHNAEEARREENIRQSLVEMSDKWRALWD